MRADPSQVSDLHRGVAGGHVHRPAGCGHRRVSGRRRPGVPRVGQPRGFEPSLHDRPHASRADDRARMARRRLWTGPGDHVRTAAAGVRRAAVQREQSAGRGSRRTAWHVRMESESSRRRVSECAGERRDRQGSDALRREPRHRMVGRGSHEGRVRLELGNGCGQALYRCRPHGESALRRCDRRPGEHGDPRVGDRSGRQGRRWRTHGVVPGPADDAGLLQRDLRGRVDGLHRGRGASVQLRQFAARGEYRLPALCHRGRCGSAGATRLQRRRRMPGAVDCRRLLLQRLEHRTRPTSSMRSAARPPTSS